MAISGLLCSCHSTPPELCAQHGGDGAFDRWFDALRAIIATTGAYDDPQPKDWRPYWEDGYSPNAALSESLSYD